MTDPIPCPSCGATACPTYSSAALAEVFTAAGMTTRCCGACSGSHDSDTYAMYYPTKESNR